MRENADPVSVDPAAPNPKLLGAERLKTFTDGVVAIALTLLVLPLLESVSDVNARHLGAAALLREHGAQLYSFALSFVIVAAFWHAHHRVFEHVRAVSPRLNTLNSVWMFGVVFLPVPTALVGAQSPDRFLLLYIGTLTLISAVLSLMTLYIGRTPQVRGPLGDFPPAPPASALATTLLFVLALGLVFIWPRLTYFPLLLLFLTPLVERLLLSVLSRQAR